MSTPAAPTPPSAWWSLTVTTAIQAMVSMALLTLPAMAPAVARALAVPSTLVGAYVALCYFAAMLSSLVGGTLVRRLGAIRVSQLGLGLCAVGLALCALPWLPAVALGALCIGAGYGPITPASSHLLALTTPAHRMSLVFSIKQTGVPLGGIIAGAIIAPLVVFAGWRWAAVALAGTCLLLGLGLPPLRAALDIEKAAARPTLKQLFRPLKTLFGMPELLRFSLISISFSALQVCLSTYLVIFLIERTGSGLIAAGLVLTATQLAGVGGRIFWGSIADWTRRPRLVLALLGLAMTAGALAMSLVDASWSHEALLALVVLFGGTAIGWNGVFLAEVARIAGPARAGELTGATAVFTFAGPMLGPSLFGLLLLLFESYGIAFAVMGGFTLIGGLLLLKDARHEHASLRQVMESAL